MNRSRTGDGELVFTTLTKEALPLVRYRTGDLTSFNRGPVPVRPHHRSHARLVGRSDDMLVVRGVNVFPSEIEQVVLDSSDLARPTSSSSTRPVPCPR